MDEMDFMTKKFNRFKKCSILEDWQYTKSYLVRTLYIKGFLLLTLFINLYVYLAYELITRVLFLCIFHSIRIASEVIKIPIILLSDKSIFKKQLRLLYCISQWKYLLWWVNNTEIIFS